MSPRRSWSVFVALAAFMACGSEEEPKQDTCGGRTCPFDYAGFDATTPNVSFETDVMPVFRRACGFSVCHGKESSSAAAELYLGPKCPPSADDPTCTQDVPDNAGRQAIVDSLVGVASKTAAAMPLVTAGSPEQSFLMLKIDGCHNSSGLTCTVQDGAKTSGACGDPMPQSSDALCQSERDTIRRWIAQGAANN
jgi:hypothetical protein